MKPKTPVILSILAMLCPIIAAISMVAIEEELAEAVLFGLLVGCALGSVFGILALVFNKNRNKIVTALSIIPICPLVLYAVLAIPHFFYR